MSERKLRILQIEAIRNERLFFSKVFDGSIWESVNCSGRTDRIFDDVFPLLPRFLVTKRAFSGAQYFDGAGAAPTLDQSPSDLVQIVSQHSQTHVAFIPRQTFVRTTIQTVMFQTVNI